MDGLLAGPAGHHAQDAAELLGRSLALRFARWKNEGVDLPGEAARLARLSGCTDPAWQGVQQAVARMTGAWRGHPYHSVGHHAEVACTATTLACLSQPGVPRPGEHGCHLLLCAALGHDFGFLPQATRKPFQLEQMAADATAAAMLEAGAPHADAAAAALLILATEPSARAALRKLAGGDASALPAPLAGLAVSADLAGLAFLLSDSDLLPSSGLTRGWSAVQADRLDRETGRTASPQEFLAFLDRLVGPRFISLQARCMDPNLQDIRADCLDRCTAQESVAVRTP